MEASLWMKACWDVGQAWIVYAVGSIYLHSEAKWIKYGWDKRRSFGHYMFILKLAFTNYYRYVDKSYNLDPCYTRTRLSMNKFIFHLRLQYLSSCSFLNARNVLFQIEEDYKAFYFSFRCLFIHFFDSILKVYVADLKDFIFRFFSPPPPHPTLY